MQRIHLVSCGNSHRNFFVRRGVWALSWKLARSALLCSLSLSFGACTSLTRQTLVPFVRDNAQRIIENEKIQRDLRVADLPLVIGFFEEPRTALQGFRLAILTLLQRSREDVQLRYFDVLIYALEDPATNVRQLATDILSAQKQKLSWQRRLLSYPLFSDYRQLPEFAELSLVSCIPKSTTATIKEAKTNAIRDGDVEGEAANRVRRFNRALVKAASILNAQVSRKQLRYLIARFSDSFELISYLAQLLSRSHPLLWVPVSRGHGGKDMAETDILSFGLEDKQFVADNYDPQSNVAYYQALGHASDQQRIIVMQSLFEQATWLSDRLKTGRHEQGQELQHRHYIQFLSSVFYFIRDEYLLVRQEAARLLSLWPVFVLGSQATGQSADPVSDFIMGQIERLQLKPSELGLVLSVLSQRNSAATPEKMLGLFYHLELNPAERTIFIQYFQSQALPFAHVYMDFLRQNQAKVSVALQLGLFDQLNEEQQEKVLQLYFYHEMEQERPYHKFFLTFLLRAVQLNLIDLLDNFFSRSVYEFYRSYSRSLFNKTMAVDLTLLQGRQNSEDLRQLVFQQRNIEELLRVVPDAVLFRLINWDSLSYFDSRDAQDLWQAYIPMKLSGNNKFHNSNPIFLNNLHGALGLQLEAVRENVKQRKAQDDERLLFTADLEQRAEDQWFLNWLKLYCIMLFRGLQSGQWPQRTDVQPQRRLADPAVEPAVSYGWNMPALPYLRQVTQVWQGLLERYRQTASATPMQVMRIEKSILAAARLLRSYRLWQAWPLYFHNSQRRSFVVYDEYLQNVLRLNERSKALQLEIQGQLLRGQLDNKRLGNLQIQFADTQLAKERELQEFLRLRNRLPADELKTATEPWQNYFLCTQMLSEEWQSASNVGKLWFCYFFPEFDGAYLGQLVQQVRQNEWLRLD